MTAMPFLYILLGLTALVVLIAFICYLYVFYARKTPPLGPDEYSIPEGKSYLPYRDQMFAWQKQMRAMPSEEFTITSFDGLKLSGKYFEQKPGAVTELMFHGYRGSAERDLCGGIQRAFALGHNVLIVDQRTSNHSEGHTITFGIKEHRDCLAWVDFAVSHFGPDIKLILTGISMGAATVVMAAGQPLPDNVVGVLADCGYDSAREIICKCAADLKIPGKLVYPFIRLGAVLFGGFDPDETSPIEAIRNCRLPIIFFHGDSDDFVPCYMSQRLYDACPSPKRLVVIPGADHGLCYLIDPEGYLREAGAFFTENNIYSYT
jgi:fermentation-respiration switch protein FrsA (DUF1100 family)